jgi:hypothetical protein
MLNLSQYHVEKDEVNNGQDLKNTYNNSMFT